MHSLAVDLSDRSGIECQDKHTVERIIRFLESDWRERMEESMG